MHRSWQIVLPVILWASAATAAPVAEVMALKGEAMLVTSDKIVALSTGVAIEEGQEIRTLKPGRLKLRFLDGSVVVIGDSSIFRIEKFRTGTANRPRQAGFMLDTGLISQTVQPSASGSWTVRTPSIVTAVRGTQFIVEVRADELTEVAVQSGAVVVEATNESQIRRRGRVRGAIGPVAAPQPVVLDRRNVGTVCTPDGECEASRPWGIARLNAVNDRLSGV